MYLKLKHNHKKFSGFLMLFYIENDKTINIDIIQLVNLQICRIV